VHGEVKLGVEQQPRSSFIHPQWWWCPKLGVLVVWQEPVLGSALVFPLPEEGDMVLEPWQVDEYTIQGWKAPCWEE
jgi:hypothetical protein